MQNIVNQVNSETVQVTFTLKSHISDKWFQFQLNLKKEMCKFLMSTLKTASKRWC